MAYLRAVKCRRCRQTLLRPDSQKQLNWPDSTPGQHCNCVTVERMLPVCASGHDRGYPEWILLCLDEGHWIKGKLLCPQCSAKIGAFNFVCGGRCSCGRGPLPPVYVNRSQVDTVVKSDPVPAIVGHHKSLSWHGKVESFDFYKRPPLVDLVQQAETSKTFRSQHRKSLSWGYRDKIGEWLEQLFTRSDSQQSLIEPLCADHQSCPDQCSCLNAREGDPLHQVNTAGHSSAVPAALQCAVCLELLCHPRVCHPCGHVFCDLCLRLIAKAHFEANQEWLVLADMCASCPLCRTHIYWTAPHRQTQERLKLEMGREYAARCRWHDQQMRWRQLPLPGDWRRLFPLAVRRWLEPAFNAMCLSLLGLIFFFILFIPGAFVSSSLYDFLVNSFSFRHFRDFGQFALGSGLLTGLALAAISTALIFVIFIG